MLIVNIITRNLCLVKCGAMVYNVKWKVATPARRIRATLPQGGGLGNN